VLFCGTRVSNVPAEEHDWWIVPFDGAPAARKATKTMALPRLAAYMGLQVVPPNRAVERISSWSGGYVYFTNTAGASESLWRLRVPGSRWSGDAEPERLTFGAGKDSRPRIMGSRLVFSSGSSDVNVFLLPARSGGRERLTSGYGRDIQPALSSDGRLLAFARDFSDRARPRQVQIMQLDSKQERAIAPSASEQNGPIISPDGKWVAFAQDAPGRVAVMLAPAGGGEAREICANCGRPQDWSPDGTQLLFETGATKATIERLDVAAQRRTEVLAHGEYHLHSPRYSPDGRWIAFYAHTGRENSRVYVARADTPSNMNEWIPMSDGAGMDVNPAWSPDGAVIYYISMSQGNGVINEQTLNPIDKRPAGKPQARERFLSPRLGVSRLTPWHAGLRAYRQGLVLSVEEQSAEIYISKLDSR
jgi:Tol biopolymer transport system component